MGGAALIRILVATLSSLLIFGAANPGSIYLPMISSGSTPTRSATETSTPTLTPIPEPSPYNVQAQAVVLQQEDMPPGFQLTNSEAISITGDAKAWGGVSAHRTYFSNEAARPFGPTKVEAGVVVFQTSAGANQAFDAEIDFTEQASSYTRISAPTYGDASAAFVASGTVEGQLVETFYIFVYLGNVWAGVRIEGLAGVTELEDSGPYIQIMLEKLQ
jgi:hypothetical protein